MRNRQTLYKMLLLGDPGVGKTTAVTCFFDKCAPVSSGYQKTIGAHFEMKSIKLGRAEVALQCWDVGGGEKFSGLSSNYYHHADAFILFYDVTNPQSFSNLSDWLAEIEKKTSPEKPAVFVLVGAKVDLAAQRRVSHANIVTMLAAIKERFSLDQSPMYQEISVNEPKKIEKLFTQTAQQLLVAFPPEAEEAPQKLNALLKNKPEHESDYAVTAATAVVMVLAVALLAALFWPAIIALSIAQIAILSVITVGVMGLALFGASKCDEVCQPVCQKPSGDSSMRQVFSELGIDAEEGLSYSSSISEDFPLDDNPIPVPYSQGDSVAGLAPRFPSRQLKS